MTNDIKFKVQLEYFNCKIKSTKMGINCDWTTITDKTASRLNEDFVLLLNPLSSLTDEDAFVIYKLNNFRAFNGKRTVPSKGITQWLIGKYFSGRKVKWDFNLASYQYLQSKGYDLPHYLLDGKTLKEAGLAIYE